MLKVIFDRRTIREYTNENVSDIMLKQILKAGLYAPFASKEIPIRYIVCDDKKIQKDLWNMHPYGKPLASASKAVIVCADIKAESTKGVYITDCAAACENILLAASSVGLGSCWIGVYPWENICNSIKDYFKLPENIVPFSIITLGYPAETPAEKDISADAFIHLNEWQQ